MTPNGTTPDGTSADLLAWKERLSAGRRNALASSFRAGVDAYRRDRDLARLGCADPFLPLTASVEERRMLLARLDHALRCERVKARAAHWTYDLNRHIALKQAREAEAALLAALIGRS